MSNNLNNNLETLFSKMENFVSTKTVVGEPIHIGEVIMLPLVDVSFGVGAGGTSAAEEKNNKGADAGGLGGRISPSAVIVIINNSVQMVNVKNQDAVSKLIDMAPGVLSKLNFGSIFNKSKDEEKKEEVKNETKIILEDTVITESFDTDK